ncbi:hypothetical protein O5O45_18700 [Hahella aquimaris]|uniref:hypothetical protein n=1 Tax=Hahella sp. HNIBRBA332 TaxID=3015983 RepID=UPI00273B75B1|nr:hypothetical protein [Hahella sp. HNIBRBA332]WLQ11761.1 hypothetical protein O5O45_18700 [Hahella sp. HNIBRBA332]
MQKQFYDQPARFAETTAVFSDGLRHRRFTQAPILNLYFPEVHICPQMGRIVIRHSENMESNLVVLMRNLDSAVRPDLSSRMTSSFFPTDAMRAFFIG